MTGLGGVLGSRWVRYALTVLLLALVLVKVDVHRLSHAATVVRPDVLLVALLLTPPFLYCKALRWHLMLRAAGVQATMREATISLLGGMGLALITPARLGELVRVAYLRDSQKMKIGGLVMVDKAFDLVVLLLLAVPGAWRLLGPGAGVLTALPALAGLAVIYRPEATAPLRRWSGRLPGGARLIRAWSSLDSLTPRNTTVYLALTLAAFAVVLLQFGVILLNWRAWSLDVVLLCFPIVILTNIMPLTVGGLGVREGTAAALLSHYGVAPADAALTAFISFFINTALPGVVGAFMTPAAAARTAPPHVPLADQP